MLKANHQVPSQPGPAVTSYKFNRNYVSESKRKLTRHSVEYYQFERTERP